MYYLFISNPDDLQKYKREFDRVKKNIDEGKTPVFNEMRSARTNIIESIPYNLIAGVFIIFGSLLADKLNENATVKIAVVMVVNNFCYASANYIFMVVKHNLRMRLCRRLEIEPNERNIAVMESLEYQSV